MLLYRDYSHHVLYSPRKRSNTEGDWTYSAIEYGLAWFFPCSFVVDDPHPAANCDLPSRRKFDDIKPNLDSALNNGEIWGGAFWDMRVALGKDVTDRLLFTTWFTLQPDEVRADRGASFVRKSIEADREHESQIRSIFAQRGLRL
jgi:hypothetical protein